MEGVGMRTVAVESAAEEAIQSRTKETGSEKEAAAAFLAVLRKQPSHLSVGRMNGQDGPSAS
jgi:hypothetical protein